MVYPGTLVFSSYLLSLSLALCLACVSFLVFSHRLCGVETDQFLYRRRFPSYGGEAIDKDAPKDAEIPDHRKHKTKPVNVDL